MRWHNFRQIAEIFAEGCRLFDDLTIYCLHASHKDERLTQQPRKAEAMSTVTAEQFCIDNAGVNYNTIREQIQAVDFGDCYPVVDSNGNLTGECVPGDAAGYSVCDISSDGGPVVHDFACEVLIEIAFCSAAELQSYIDARCGGLVVAVSSDGLEVAFGDENHSPTEAEFEALSGLTADYVDGVIAEFILATQTN